MSRNKAGQGHATKQLEAMYQFAVIAARLSSRHHMLCAEWDDFNIHGEASHMAAGFAFALAGLLNAYSF